MLMRDLFAVANLLVFTATLEVVNKLPSDSAHSDDSVSNKSYLRGTQIIHCTSRIVVHITL